jgi:large subunit ribosomal protein L24
VSNVSLIDPKDQKPTRIGIAREGGQRYRVARRSNTRID